MKNILILAKLTIHLAFKKGLLWGLPVLIAAILSFVFLFSTGDNILINELQLRIQYSYSITYSILTLIIISISCFTIRSQIDDRQIHMLTAFPVSRQQIWIGKWLGLFILANILQFILILGLFICSIFFCRTFPAEEITVAKTHFERVKHEEFPVRTSFATLTKNRISHLIELGQLDPKKIDDGIRKNVFDQVRRDELQISPYGEKTWEFDIGNKPDYGEYIEVKFKFYAEHRRRSVPGSWVLTDHNGNQLFLADFEAYPYAINSIKIPIKIIPDTGEFLLVFKSRNPSNLIFGTKSGLRLYYDEGKLVSNVLKAYVTQAMHLGITIGVGLTAGVAFTFPVASFFSIVLYFLSVSSGFFTQIVQDLGFEYHISIIDKLSVTIIQFGMWLAKGLQPPVIISHLSSGITIPLNDLLISWLPAILMYGFFTTVLGISLLSKKELDKIPG